MQNKIENIFKIFLKMILLYSLHETTG